MEIGLFRKRVKRIAKDRAADRAYVLNGSEGEALEALHEHFDTISSDFDAGVARAEKQGLIHFVMRWPRHEELQEMLVAYSEQEGFEELAGLSKDFICFIRCGASEKDAETSLTLEREMRAGGV